MGVAARDKALATHAKPLGKRLKKFGAGLAKAGGVFRAQVFQLPQPPKVARDLKAGVTEDLIKPTAFISLVTAFEPGTGTDPVPRSVVIAFALADPANGSTVDLTPVTAR